MSNAKDKKVEELTVDQQLSNLSTVSAKIRLLTSLNFSRSEIASKLAIRYQHVRNVQLMVLKKPEPK